MQVMEDLDSFSAGNLISGAVPCDRGMGSTSQSSLAAEVRTRIGTEAGPGSTKEEGEPPELGGINLLALGSQDVLEIPAAAVGEEAVRAEVKFLITGGGVTSSTNFAFRLDPGALPKSTSSKARSAPSSSRSSVAMVTLPRASTCDRSFFQPF